MGNELHDYQLLKASNEIKEKINSLIKENEVCLFMKATQILLNVDFQFLSNILKHLKVDLKE